jgi:hypothetical protein
MRFVAIGHITMRFRRLSKRVDELILIHFNPHRPATDRTPYHRGPHFLSWIRMISSNSEYEMDLPS